MTELQIDTDYLALDGLYAAPGRGQPLLMLAHGAGAPMDHVHMTALAVALSSVGIGTLRFNFPFMQQGRRRVDPFEVCLASIDAVCSRAGELAPDASLLVGGHSFGGRMSTHWLAERQPDIAGGILFSFPLHVTRKPDTKRAQHLKDIDRPLLFVSGDRDPLADAGLMQDVIGPLPGATIHWLETADHSFNTLKRTRQSSEDVYHEVARITASWVASLH